MGEEKRGMAMKMQRDQDGQAAARRSKHSAAPGSVRGKARPAGGWLLARLRRGDEGQAIVEFALVLPMLLLLFTGIFILSVVMYKQILLRTAASQGVQVLALSQNVPGIADPCTAATTAIGHATALDPSKIGITYYNGPAGGAVIAAGSTCEGITKGTQLTVTLTYPCSFALIYNFNQICAPLSVSESEPAQ
jgi:Flp pilus assembly protein TadG